MEAIVLAGGFGTRLRSVISDVPKPMAPVLGRPFLEYILDDLIKKGVNRIVLAVSYKYEIIKNYFGYSYRDVEIIYSIEESPLLTGGAIKQALGFCFEEEVFVVNGDTFFDVDLRSMKYFKKTKDALFVLATCSMKNFDRYGTVEVDDSNCITCFNEKKPTDKGLINGGVYLLNKSIFKDIAEVSFSLEEKVLDSLLLSRAVFSFSSNGYFIDIGIPSEYERVQHDFKCRFS